MNKIHFSLTKQSAKLSSASQYMIQYTYISNSCGEQRTKPPNSLTHSLIHSTTAIRDIPFKKRKIGKQHVMISFKIKL